MSKAHIMKGILLNYKSKASSFIKNLGDRISGGIHREVMGVKNNKLFVCRYFRILQQVLSRGLLQKL